MAIVSFMDGRVFVHGSCLLAHRRDDNTIVDLHSVNLQRREDGLLRLNIPRSSRRRVLNRREERNLEGLSV